ncbi:MAG: metallophosphoesterase [Planctomycetaceae bacterium]|jgi:exonuclease SbcD|nr:metallophosphoesterase [Planctomycetaceae bacterium]
MGKESIRFLHAGDFHLERPMQDLTDIPEHLKAALVDAPWKAAEAVFEAAIVENVDFVLLTGDLLNPITTGASGPAFLLDQFERLAHRNISVYWAGGSVDEPDRWPEAVSLPSNVHYFSKKEVQSVVFRRNGSALATILGRSSDGRESIRSAEYQCDADGTYVIALAHGNADRDSLLSERIDFWALGNDHNRKTLHGEAPHMRVCGSTQGRGFSEEGAHGFWTIEVDGTHDAQITTTDVDYFRYITQTLDVEDLAMGRDMRELMSKRISRLQSEHGTRHLIIRWRVELDLENAAMVGPEAIDEILGWLRREYSHGACSVWSTEIEILSPKSYPAKWQEEDTILGDFLRTSQEHRKSLGQHLNLKPLLESETLGTNAWQQLLIDDTPSVTSGALDRATLLGVDMLRGHKVDLIAPTRRFGGTRG